MAKNLLRSRSGQSPFLVLLLIDKIFFEHDFEILIQKAHWMEKTRLHNEWIRQNGSKK